MTHTGHNIKYQRRFLNASLASGAFEVFQETRADIKREFLNKNFLAVHNQSGEVQEIHVDGRRADGDTEAKTYLVPAGANVVLIEPDDGDFFMFVEIENKDGTNTSAAGEIVIIYKVVEVR